MLVNIVDISRFVVPDALGAVKGVEENHLEGFMVIDVIWEIGGVCDAIIGVIEITDGESGILQGSDANEVREFAVSVDDLHHLIAIAFHPVFAGRIQPILG